MKILVIDDSSDFRNLLRMLLTEAIPGVEMGEYDPAEHGRPPDNFGWDAYDVLLLDYQLGLDEDGLDWLRAVRRQKIWDTTSKKLRETFIHYNLVLLVHTVF